MYYAYKLFWHMSMSLKCTSDAQSFKPNRDGNGEKKVMADGLNRFVQHTEVKNPDGVQMAIRKCAKGACLNVIYR